VSKAEKLYEAITALPDGTVETAQSVLLWQAERRWVRWAALAAMVACLCLGAGAVWAFSYLSLNGGDASAPGASSPSAGGMSGHDGGSVFMSYAGPIFPLTLKEETPGLTAERSITMDFSGYAPGGTGNAGLLAGDSYVLTNPGEQDRAVTALYPFAGSFPSLQKIRPEIRVNGEAAETELSVGGYCGGFQGMMNPDSGDSGLYNLKQPQSWEDYRDILADGTYQAGAFAPPPALDEPVTVYAFDDAKAPTEQYDAATLAVSFPIDPARTTVCTWNFNGSDFDQETGWRQYSFFVDKFGRWQPRYLIVQGEDIGEYTIRGYENGGCEREIDGVSATVTRRETTMGEILGEIVADFQQSQQTGYWAGRVPEALLYRAAAQSLVNYAGTVERYGIFGERLDELVLDATVMERVFYLAFDVTVPAGGSVEVSASFQKEASFDFACGQTKNRDVYGYDLVTRLGSSLCFTAQKAELVNTDGIEIVRQNFGFDLSKGVAAVTLDSAREHYYLEVRRSAG